jgi:hypothetical protein
MLKELDFYPSLQSGLMTKRTVSLTPAFRLGTLLPRTAKGFSPEQSFGYPISSIYCNDKESWFFNPSL